MSAAQCWPVKPTDRDDVLTEPDRPGDWWHRLSEHHKWHMVGVSWMGGSRELQCRVLGMADVDARPWSGHWVLYRQAGPAHGRERKHWRP